MQYPITIQFTPTEWYIVEDRLAVPDAIAEALTEDDDSLDRDSVSDAARWLWIRGREVTLNDPIDLLVFTDAIEGSTMPAKLQDEVMWGDNATAKACRAKLRHIPKIESKLKAAGLTGIRFPKG